MKPEGYELITAALGTIEDIVDFEVQPRPVEGQDVYRVMVDAIPNDPSKVLDSLAEAGLIKGSTPQDAPVVEGRPQLEWRSTSTLAKDGYAHIEFVDTSTPSDESFFGQPK